MSPEQLAEILFPPPMEEEIPIPPAIEDMAMIPLGEVIADPENVPDAEKADELIDQALNADLARIGDPDNLPPERDNPSRKNPGNRRNQNLQRFIEERAKELSNQQMHNLMRKLDGNSGYVRGLAQARKLGPALRRDLKQYKRYIQSVASICESLVENVCEEIVDTHGVIAHEDENFRDINLGYNTVQANMRAISVEIIEGMIQLDHAALLITGYAESIAHIMQQLPPVVFSESIKELYTVHQLTGTARQLLEGLDFGTTPLDIIGETFSPTVQIDNFAKICEQLVIVCKIRNSIVASIHNKDAQDKRLQGHLKRAFDTIVNGANKYRRSIDGGLYLLKTSADIESLSRNTRFLREYTRQAALTTETIVTQTTPRRFRGPKVKKTSIWTADKSRPRGL